MDINATLFVQMVSFIILVAFTMKFIWPHLIQTLEEREKKIASGLEAAERSKRELEMAEHKALDIIKEAKQNAASILDQANRRSLQIVDEAKESAREEGRRILEQANDEFAREVSKTKEELRKRLAGLAVKGAERVIKRNLDNNTQQALLDDFVAEL